MNRDEVTSVEVGLEACWLWFLVSLKFHKGRAKEKLENPKRMEESSKALNMNLIDIEPWMRTKPIDQKKATLRVMSLSVKKGQYPKREFF